MGKLDSGFALGHLLKNLETAERGPSLRCGDVVASRLPRSKGLRWRQASLAQRRRDGADPLMGDPHPRHGKRAGPELRLTGFGMPDLWSIPDSAAVAESLPCFVRKTSSSMPKRSLFAKVGNLAASD